ncbi:MAG TPA: CBS domain-containing protein [Myxococcota bacterium]|jgi:CBS domain-containing protein|nr:CBS domain-containing protein [Myxococcota bacterium]
MHSIRHLLKPLDLVSATPDMAVMDVVRRMTDAKVGAIAIAHDGWVVGVFSERDLMTRVVMAGLDPYRLRVDEVMTHDVITATARTTRAEAMEKMLRAGCRHLPVIDDEGRVVAMLSMRDLLRDEIDEQSEEIRGLREYLHQSPIL